jgi:hypothetical protein
MTVGVPLWNIGVPEHTTGVDYFRAETFNASKPYT